jgi:hypothetical protein
MRDLEIEGELVIKQAEKNMRATGLGELRAAWE